MATKPKKNDALALYDERLAALAKSAKRAEARVGGSGSFISLKGGVMTYQGGTIPESRLLCVVLDAVLENQWYDGPFDPDNFAAPACYAFGRDPDAMTPRPEDVPAAVSPACAGCPKNEWGSADVGRGKACKEVRRLALISEGDLDPKKGAGPADAEVAYMKVPVTSTKAWAGYVRSLEEAYGRPPLAFVTEVRVVKEQTTKLPGWHLEFRMAREIDDGPTLGALLARRDLVEKEIAFPYPRPEAAAPRGKGKAPARGGAKPAQAAFGGRAAARR